MIVVLVLIFGFEFAFLVILRNARVMEHPDVDADGGADTGWHDERIGFISTFDASEWPALSRHQVLSLYRAGFAVPFCQHTDSWVVFPAVLGNMDVMMLSTGFETGNGNAIIKPTMRLLYISFMVRQAPLFMRL